MKKPNFYMISCVLCWILAAAILYIAPFVYAEAGGLSGIASAGMVFMFWGIGYLNLMVYRRDSVDHHKASTKTQHNTKTANKKTHTQ